MVEPEFKCKAIALELTFLTSTLCSLWANTAIKPGDLRELNRRTEPGRELQACEVLWSRSALMAQYGCGPWGVVTHGTPSWALGVPDVNVIV